MKFGWFVLGTVVGAMVYACLAQQTGSEVRANIADAATRTKEIVQDAVEEISLAID